MNEYFAVLLATLFVVLAFLIAFRKGVIGILASGSALAAGFAVFLLSFAYLSPLSQTYLGVALSWQVMLGASFVLALAVSVPLRIVLTKVLKGFFNPDTPFHRFVDGSVGALLSLIPSLVGVFIFFSCLRVTGTVQELAYIDALTQKQIGITSELPTFPLSATWRNGIERLPYIPDLLDKVDPISRRASRNVAAFILASRGAMLRDFLLERKETSAFMGSSRWAEITADERISQILKRQDLIALVLSSPVKTLANSPSANPDLSRLVLEPALKDFIATLQEQIPGNKAGSVTP